MSRSAESFPADNSISNPSELPFRTSGCEFSSDCQAEHTLWEDAAVDALDAHITSGATCLAIILAPPPVDAAAALACGPVLLHEAVMVYRANRARNVYWACMRKNGLNQTRTGFTTELESLMGASRRSTDTETGLLPGGILRACEEFDDQGGGGGGFSPDGGPGLSCRAETWEISYDGGDTWSPITVTVCEMS
jgi:hypothetical protein